MKPRAATRADRNPFSLYVREFLEWARAIGRSDQTVDTRARALKRFIAWCDERGIDHPKDVTLAVLERYQRHLFHYRKPNGEPLTFGSQQTMLVPLKSFFQWAARDRHILYNPASELELPSLPRRLPKHILTVETSRRSSTSPTAPHRRGYAIARSWKPSTRPVSAARS